MAASHSSDRHSSAANRTGMVRPAKAMTLNNIKKDDISKNIEKYKERSSELDKLLPGMPEGETKDLLVEHRLTDQERERLPDLPAGKHLLINQFSLIGAYHRYTEQEAELNTLNFAGLIVQPPKQRDERTDQGKAFNSFYYDAMGRFVDWILHREDAATRIKNWLLDDFKIEGMTSVGAVLNLFRPRDRKKKIELEYLSLNGLDLTEEDFKVLFKSMNNWVSFKRINLSHNRIKKDFNRRFLIMGTDLIIED